MMNKQSLTKLSSTDVNFIASHALARSQQQLQSSGGGDDENENDAMAALERQARAPVGFVIASSSEAEARAGIQEGTAVTTNPDALDVSLDD